MRMDAVYIASCLVLIVRAVFGNDLRKPIGQRCKSLDIVFVLDSSYSVGATNFNIMLHTCKHIVSDHTIGATQFGLDVFSTAAKTEIKLKDYNQETEKDQLINAISNVQYIGGLTNIHLAIYHLIMYSFSSSYGARPWAQKVAILMTDGKSQEKRRTIKAANRARKFGFSFIVIGIGPGIDWEEIEAIAGGRASAVRVRSFESLKRFDVSSLPVIKKC